LETIGEHLANSGFGSLQLELEKFSLSKYWSQSKSEEFIGSQTNFCSRKTPQSKLKLNTPKSIVPTNPKQPLKILEQALIPTL